MSEGGLTVIAETDAHFADFAPYVASIDGDGVVAFQATTREGRSGVYVGDGRVIRPVVVGGLQVESHPEVDGRGGVSFYARNGERSGVYVVRGGEVEALVESGEWLGAIGPLGPTASDDGEVAFRGTLVDGRAGVFLASEGGVRAIAVTGGAFAAFHGLPVAVGGGAVVFRAQETDGRHGIWRGDGRGSEAVVTTGERFTSLGLFPSANGRGDVVFVGVEAGGSGVFRARGGAVERVAGGTGAYEGFRGALINEAGDIVFYATPVGGQMGVYRLGEDRPVVAMGDERFGSRVTDLALNPVSLNRAGALAIRLGFADGGQRVVRVG